MTMRLLSLALLLGCLAAGPAWADQANAQQAHPSEATQTCLDCHTVVTPGIVADWRKSRMARRTVAQALKEPELNRRVSVKAAQLPATLTAKVVGCAECHTLRAGQHPGTFDHEGFKVHTVVSPADCATCHPVEAEQYGQNIMAHARGNLARNPLYTKLVDQVNGTPVVEDDGRLAMRPPSALTQADSCFYCHGTEVKVLGQTTRETDFGQMTFAKLGGWPNHGSGRHNPDNSLGSCTPCHARHQFSIALARQPSTCKECHTGPDVLAYKIYQVSKHGNIFAALKGQMNLDAVPWAIGKDINAPTCATCHISLVTDETGMVLARRTHRMNDRLWQRLLGLIYSHPHPKDPDTTKIVNADGQTLATTLAGKPASKYLIGPEEQAKRQEAMRKVCLGCHSGQWVDGHMARLAESIKTTDAATLAATRLIQTAWGQGLAQGPPDGNPFDEYAERLWVQQWLFYANSIRFSSAMAGADYGVFENGRWEQMRGVRQLHDWLRDRQAR